MLSKTSVYTRIHILVSNMVAERGNTPRTGYGKGGDTVMAMKKKLLKTIIKEISAVVDEAFGEDKEEGIIILGNDYRDTVTVKKSKLLEKIIEEVTMVVETAIGNGSGRDRNLKKKANQRITEAKKRELLEEIMKEVSGVLEAAIGDGSGSGWKRDEG